MFNSGSSPEIVNRNTYGEDFSRNLEGSVSTKQLQCYSLGGLILTARNTTHPQDKSICYNKTWSNRKDHERELDELKCCSHCISEEH